MSNYHRKAARTREQQLAPAIPKHKDSGVLMSKATERRADLGSKSTNAEDGAAGGMGIRRDMQMIKNNAMRARAGYATTYDSNAKMKAGLREYKNQKNQSKTRAGRSK